LHWAERGGATWAERGKKRESRGWAGLIAGPAQKKRKEMGRGGVSTGWAREEDWAGLVLGFWFPFLFLFSYFKHYSNLIEFKYKFEFNPSTQTNKRDAPA